MRRIHLDDAGGRPLHPEIQQAIAHALETLWASPSGMHAPAGAAQTAIDDARSDVAALIGAEPDDVFFTSGATESRITAVNGLAKANQSLGTHAVASELEHPTVLWALRRREASGSPWTSVPVDGEGYLAPNAVADAVRDDTVLVCLHHAQHDVGTLQDVTETVARVRERRPDVRIHVDASASLGVCAVDVTTWDADAVTIGGTALGCPEWIGALWVRPGARMLPLIGGSTQEMGRRSGGENVPGAIALGTAARRARIEHEARAARLRGLTAHLWDGLRAIGEMRLNGPGIDTRLAGNLHVSIGGVTGETLAVALDAYGISVAPGSTCSALAGKASPVLEAMDVEAPWSHAGVLFTIGDHIDEDEIDEALLRIRECVTSLRAHSLLGR